MRGRSGQDYHSVDGTSSAIGHGMTGPGVIVSEGLPVYIVESVGYHAGVGVLGQMLPRTKMVRCEGLGAK